MRNKRIRINWEKIYNSKYENFQEKSVLFWIQGILGYLLLYPLHLICILFFIKDPNIYWLLCFVLLFIVYYRAYYPYGYFKSFKVINTFYDEFLGDKKKFELIKSETLTSRIYSSENISLLRKKYLFGKNIIKLDKAALQLLKYPIFAFVAQPISNKLLGECKAYCNFAGQFIIVCRSDQLDEHPFEKFLFYHEFEHVNDTGWTQLYSKYRIEFAYFLHTFFFLFYFEHWWQYIILFIYAFYLRTEHFLNYRITRETIADYQAFKKLDEHERKSVKKLLSYLWESTITSLKGEKITNTVNPVKVHEIKMRYAQLLNVSFDFLQSYINGDSEFKKYAKELFKLAEKEETLMPPNIHHNINNSRIAFISMILLCSSYNLKPICSAENATYILISLILISLIISFLFTIKSKRIYKKVYEKLESENLILKNYSLENDLRFDSSLE